MTEKNTSSYEDLAEHVKGGLESLVEIVLASDVDAHLKFSLLNFVIIEVLHVCDEILALSLKSGGATTRVDWHSGLNKHLNDIGITILSSKELN